MVREQETTAMIEIPRRLFEAANRIAERNSWTIQQAVAFLLKRGIKAQAEAELAVTSAYDSFMNAEGDEEQAAGDNLIRSIFGPSSVA